MRSRKRLKSMFRKRECNSPVKLKSNKQHYAPYSRENTLKLINQFNNIEKQKHKILMTEDSDDNGMQFRYTMMPGIKQRAKDFQEYIERSGRHQTKLEFYLRRSQDIAYKNYSNRERRMVEKLKQKQIDIMKKKPSYNVASIFGRDYKHKFSSGKSKRKLFSQTTIKSPKFQQAYMNPFLTKGKTDFRMTNYGRKTLRNMFYRDNPIEHKIQVKINKKYKSVSKSNSTDRRKKYKIKSPTLKCKDYSILDRYKEVTRKLQLKNNQQSIISINQGKFKDCNIIPYSQKSTVKLSFKEVFGKFYLLTNNLEGGINEQAYQINQKTKSIELIQSPNKLGIQIFLTFHGLDQNNYMKVTPSYKTTKFGIKRKSKKINTEGEQRIVYNQNETDPKKMDMFQLRLRSEHIFNKKRLQTLEKYGKCGNKIRQNKKNILGKIQSQKEFLHSDYLNQHMNTVYNKAVCQKLIIKTKRELKLSERLNRIDYIREKRGEFNAKKKRMFIKGHWLTILSISYFVQFSKIRLISGRILQKQRAFQLRCYRTIQDAYRSWQITQQILDPTGEIRIAPYIKWTTGLHLKCSYKIAIHNAGRLVTRYLSLCPFTLTFVKSARRYYKAINFVKNRMIQLRRIKYKHFKDLDDEITKSLLFKNWGITINEIKASVKEKVLKKFFDKRWYSYCRKYEEHLIHKNKKLTKAEKMMDEIIQKREREREQSLQIEEGVEGKIFDQTSIKGSIPNSKANSKTNSKVNSKTTSKANSQINSLVNSQNQKRKRLRRQGKSGSRLFLQKQQNKEDKFFHSEIFTRGNLSKKTIMIFLAMSMQPPKYDGQPSEKQIRQMIQKIKVLNFEVLSEEEFGQK